MPLLEVTNEARRRPMKVYGRRRCGLPEAREIHRQLFGSDENEIEKRLERISLSSKPESPPLTEPLPIKPPNVPSKTQSPPRRQSQETSEPPPSSRKTPQRPPDPQNPPRTKCSTLKRHRSKHTHTSSAIPLSPTEHHLLKPLLSQPNVHPHVISFPTFASRILSRFVVSKSGEGSFSECLLLQHKTQPSDAAILKIIPFDLSTLNDSPSAEVAGNPPPAEDTPPSITNSTVSAVLREVQILASLSPYHGFTSLRSCHVVRGPWHDGFLDAYHAFRRRHPHLAVNPLPSERWDQDMIYGVIEMDDAGADLESLAKPSAFQVYDAFWMAVVLLAVVEKEREFEHRDLHMSNICFRERRPGGGYDVAAHDAKTMTERPGVLLGMTNLKITIIDYTMSRLRSETDRVLYNPESAWSAADDTPADTQEDHQAITGQRMRRLALQHSQQTISPSAARSPPPTDDDPSWRPLDTTPPNMWRDHIPQTNVIWLAHLLYQLLQQAGARPRCATGSNACAKRLQREMWKKLKQVLALIDTCDPAVGSTAELLGTAIEEGWITEKDVEGFKQRLNEESWSSGTD